MVPSYEPEVKNVYPACQALHGKAPLCSRESTRSTGNGVNLLDLDHK